MPTRRYQEQSLSDAAAAAGSAFGLENEPALAESTRTPLDLGGLAAIAAGLGILVTLLAYILR